MTEPTIAPSTRPPRASVPRPLPEQGVILAPRPWVPLGVLILGLAALALNPWLALGLSLFGLFLLVQSQLLRLQFAADGLFPYSEWLSWKLFWPPLPVLFYFREQRSIHLLPVLFDATSLRDQLDRHVSAPPSAQP
jgi:Protein of unknown function (DUF3119)